MQKNQVVQGHRPIPTPVRSDHDSSTAGPFDETIPAVIAPQLNLFFNYVWKNAHCLFSAQDTPGTPEFPQGPMLPSQSDCEEDDDSSQHMVLDSNDMSLWCHYIIFA